MEWVQTLEDNCFESSVWRFYREKTCFVAKLSRYCQINFTEYTQTAAHVKLVQENGQKSKDIFVQSPEITVDEDNFSLCINQSANHLLDQENFRYFQLDVKV